MLLAQIINTCPETQIIYFFLFIKIFFLSFFIYVFQLHPQQPIRMVERLIVVLDCLRTVNIDLLAHSSREDTSVCYPCSSWDLLSSTVVQEPASRLLEVGGCLTRAL